MFSIFQLIVCLLCALRIKSMAIHGPALTRYDPCGLGVIYFDRLDVNFWQGVVSLGLYPNLNEAKIAITFEDEVQIQESSQNASMIVSERSREIILVPKGDLSKLFIFYVTTYNSTINESDVPEISQFSLNDVALCNENIKASQTVESFNVTLNDVDGYKHVCGRRTLDNTELTSFRTEAREGDWPWHVALFIKNEDTDENSYRCGGNIISRVAIVTAGHCVVFDQVTVEAYRTLAVAGISDRSDLHQIGRQALTAEEIIVHPSYTDMQATSDIAIIKVDKWIYTDFVQPICVWGPLFNKETLFGIQATVVGFGMTEQNLPSNELRSTYTMVQNDSVCIDYDEPLYTPLLNEFTFCAGYGDSGINPRSGDSGGGLVLPTMQPDQRISWFLRGILSKCGVAPGHSECDPEYYVIYVDVGPHYGWIYKHSGLKYKSNILNSKRP